MLGIVTEGIKLNHLVNVWETDFGLSTYVFVMLLNSAHGFSEGLVRFGDLKLKQLGNEYETNQQCILPGC